MALTQRRADELVKDDVIIRRGTRYRILERPLVDATLRVRFVVEGPAGHHDICLNRGAVVDVDITTGARPATQLAANLRIDLDGQRWRIVYAGPAPPLARPHRPQPRGPPWRPPVPPDRRRRARHSGRTMTGGLFGDEELAELTTVDVDPLDAIIAARLEADRARNARRRGTRRSHPCPACGARTFRRPRRYPSRGIVDDRCTRCAEGNELTGLGPVEATQHVDRAGLNSGLDDRPRCPVHTTQLAPCAICAIFLEEPEP